jgi:hypothetical protein
MKVCRQDQSISIIGQRGVAMKLTDRIFFFPVLFTLSVIPMIITQNKFMGYELSIMRVCIRLAAAGSTGLFCHFYLKKSTQLFSTLFIKLFKNDGGKKEAGSGILWLKSIFFFWLYQLVLGIWLFIIAFFVMGLPDLKIPLNFMLAFAVLIPAFCAFLGIGTGTIHFFIVQKKRKLHEKTNAR